MKRIVIVKLIAGIVILLLNSCKKENSCDCFKGTGTIVSEMRKLPSFDRLLVENDVNVYLKQDSVFDIQVTAGKNLITLIKTEVKNGELTIKNNNKCNFIRSYEPKINIYISMPRVIYITHNGTGTVQSVNTFTSREFDIWTKNAGNVIMDVNNEKLHTHLQRNGDIILTGRTTDFTCFADHSGVLAAASFVVDKYAWVFSKSTGDVHFSIADGLMDVTLVCVGNAYYSGNPKDIVIREDDKGRVIKQ